MQLSSHEIAALRRGERLEVEVPEAGGFCWIVRKADLARWLGLDFTDLPMTTVSALVDTALRDEDSDDPLLASYQSCRP